MWAFSVLLILGGGVLSAWTLKRGTEEVRLDLGSREVVDLNGNGSDHSDADIHTLAGRKISRKIVKKVVPPPPPPPKPPAPPLEKLIKLSGVMDFGGGNPPEAIIETLQNRKTKNYKDGDRLTPVPATIESIGGDVVVVVYDEKKWKVTYAGAELIPDKKLKGQGP